MQPHAGLHLEVDGLCQHRNGHVVQNLAGGDGHSGGEHLGDRVAGGLDVRELQAGADGVGRGGQNLHGGLGDHPQGALRGAEKLGQVVAAGGLGGLGAGVQDAPVGQHHFEGHHVVLGGAVLHRPDAAGVGVDHAADGGDARAARIGREEEALLGNRRVQRPADHAALNPGVVVGQVDLQDLVHADEVKKHPALGGQGRSGDAGAAATGDHRHLGLVTGGQNLAYLLGGFGEYHHLGRGHVHRHVP